MIHQTTTIICDDCIQTMGEYENKSATNARRDLERFGWTYIGKPDRCKICTEQYYKRPVIAARIYKK